MRLGAQGLMRLEHSTAEMIDITQNLQKANRGTNTAVQKVSCPPLRAQVVLSQSSPCTNPPPPRQTHSCCTRAAEWMWPRISGDSKSCGSSPLLHHSLDSVRRQLITISKVSAMKHCPWRSTIQCTPLVTRCVVLESLAKSIRK